MNNIERNASLELDRLTKIYMRENDVDYRTAYYAVAEGQPKLMARYGDHRGVTVEEKTYDLSPVRREMAVLLADRQKTQRLAGDRVDRLAKVIVDSKRPVIDPAAAYKSAVLEVLKRDKSLRDALESGFIAATDFRLLGQLIPALSREIEQGNYESKLDFGRRYSSSMTLDDLYAYYK